MSRRNVVLFGSYDASLHPRVAVLREGLAATEDVTEINVPLGLSTADKVDAASSLGGAVRLLVAVARAWVPLWRRGRSCGVDPDLVVVGYLGHLDVHLARLLWPRTPIALDHLVGLADTSRDRGVATGLKARLLDLVDRAALCAADVVVVDTVEQQEQLAELGGPTSVVVPVGATTEWFEQRAPAPPPPLRVCFVGLFTPLHGAPTIGRALARLAGDDRFRFTMVGTGQDLDATRAAAGGSELVEWIDWVAGAELPSFVARHHVTLGIFGTTPKAMRVVPTKVYQGLAAGNVVVTSDTAPQRRALGDAAHYVPPGDPDALVAALEQVASASIAAGESFAAQRRQVADRFRPAVVVEPMLDAWARLPHRRRGRRTALSR